MVTSSWSIGLPTYLASSLDIAVLEVRTFHCSKFLMHNLLFKLNAIQHMKQWSQVDLLGSSGEGDGERSKRFHGVVGLDDVKDTQELIRF